MKVSGMFEVMLSPLDAHHEGEYGVRLRRMALKKTYMGELEARSQGEMLSAMAGVAGSAGYVAMEQVDGVLDGRQGSFVLQHSGTMQAGENTLTLTVVPDSGTGKLQGLSGSMTIKVDEEGQHFYEFEFTLSQD